MKLKLVAFLAIVVAGCGGGELSTQYLAQAGPGAVSNSVDPFMSKADLARYLTFEVSDRYGSSSFRSMSVKSPRGYDFTPIGTQFSEHAGIPYSTVNPAIVVEYRLENTLGYRSRLSSQNYHLTASLVRADELMGGKEVIRTTSRKFSCHTDKTESENGLCEDKVPKIAEELLYEFCCSPRLPKPADSAD